MCLRFVTNPSPEIAHTPPRLILSKQGAANHGQNTNLQVETCAKDPRILRYMILDHSHEARVYQRRDRVVQAE